MKISQKLLDICNLLDDKKANDIVVCNMEKITNVVDYYVLATATSTTHIKSLADYLEEKSTREESFSFVGREGFNNSEWVVLDFDDVFVHIFTKEKREYYNLEKLINEGNNIKSFDKIKKEIAKQEKVKQKSNKEKQKAEKQPKSKKIKESVKNK